MRAVIAFFFPAAVVVFLWRRLFKQKFNGKSVLIGYAAGFLLLNFLVTAVAYGLFGSTGNVISNINCYGRFAVKYIALALFLAVLIPCACKCVKILREQFRSDKSERENTGTDTLPDESGEQTEVKYTRRQKGKIAGKITAFIAIFAILFVAGNFAFQPVWTAWNNYNTTRGIYEEPENTIEVVFFGASIVANGIIPSSLYEDYGISSYNLGMEQQPLMTSYYWLEEVYRLQSDSLTTVVLDVSELRHTPTEAFFHKAFDGMQYSSVRLRAAWDYADEDLHTALTFLIPFFSYHDRWQELSKTDFKKSSYEPESYLRGYNFASTRYIDSTSWDSMTIKNGVLDESVEAQELDEDSIYYLEQMVAFCEQNDLQLVLIKTPHGYWNSAYHNAVETIADDYGLTFLDLNFDPLLSELNFNMSSDLKDSGHANYYGASKLTAYLGQWLTENADVTDVRGDEDYAFMEEELEKYHRRVTDVMDLKEETDPAEYISKAAENEDNEIFIIVKDTIAAHLTDEQREAFSEMGLTVLSEQTYGSSYIGIIDEGEVIYEDTIVFDSDAYNAAVEEEEEYEYETLTYSTLIDDGSLVLLESGGYRIGNIASCEIDGTEYAVNTRGLNIVVYNKELKTVTDSAVFDLHVSSTRENFNIEEALAEAEEAGTDFDNLSDTLQEYVKYNRRTELSALAATIDLEAGDDGLLTYLEAYAQEEDLAIFLSVKDEAADSLSDEVREYLAELGLSVLSEIEHRDSYIGVILDGEVVYEETNHGETEIAYSDIWYSVESGGYDSGNTSSIEINGIEYSTAARGINIVVYDTVLGIVVDTSNFDTYATEQTVPDGEGE